MFTATIDTKEIHRNAYRITAAKSRFVTDKNYEDYTFDMDDQAKEDAVVVTGPMMGGSVTLTEDVIADGLVKRIITLSYGSSDLTNAIVTLTRQKGRNVRSDSGLSLMDIITFSEAATTNTSISPSKDGVFTLCRQVTAKRAKAIIAAGGSNFDIITLTSDDQELFDSLYSRAFSELMGELAVLIDAFVADTSFSLVAGFPGSVGGAIVSATENYLFSNVMAQFYRIAGLADQVAIYQTEALTNAIKVKNLLSAQADSDQLLKAIINDAAVRFQASLYPLSKRATPGTDMFLNTGSSIEFSFELKDIPISASAIQLIYNIGRQVLINGALSKWYTMAGIADDKNEAKAELTSSLEILSFIIQDRLRFIGLFDQFLKEAINKVRERMLAHSKQIGVLDYALDPTTGLLSFNLANKDWEDNLPQSINFQDHLLENMKEALYRYVLKEWWRLTNVPDYEAEELNYQEAIKGVTNALHITYKPIVRSGSFL